MSEFLGLPVNEFDKQVTHSLIKQLPISDLGDAFSALLNDENVISFGWEQYTPYFNDGDVCEFSVGELWVRTTLNSEDDESYNMSVGGNPAFSDTVYHPTVWEPAWVNGYWNNCGKLVKRSWWESVDVKLPETARNAKNLSKLLQSGHYDDGLYEEFGDHAMITVTRDGIDVEFYKHD